MEKIDFSEIAKYDEIIFPVIAKNLGPIKTNKDYDEAQIVFSLGGVNGVFKYNQTNYICKLGLVIDNALCNGKLIELNLKFKPAFNLFYFRRCKQRQSGSNVYWTYSCDFIFRHFNFGTFHQFFNISQSKKETNAKLSKSYSKD